ncbi:hypothetical protein BU14_0202s0028 [Porphyra umbilicalis]|uniref:Uncharacterized protein n=1 Tax=Porphyra umbilicalis TaxID=2786 RepID=A0A1X6P5R3_PORUM|nr:hypothetical protein BU14_0202s0028 [Porphyra umbilicalis]|eukprot:OSX76241.1 hypothetical protein BU14_0202s0028 [Porphyra umbilicalis]
MSAVPPISAGRASARRRLGAHLVPIGVWLPVWLVVCRDGVVVGRYVGRGCGLGGGGGAAAAAALAAAGRASVRASGGALPLAKSSRGCCSWMHVWPPARCFDDQAYLERQLRLPGTSPRSGRGSPTALPSPGARRSCTRLVGPGLSWSEREGLLLLGRGSEGGEAESDRVQGGVRRGEGAR